MNEDWEKKFDWAFGLTKDFPRGKTHLALDEMNVKDFIRFLLSAQREEMRENARKMPRYDVYDGGEAVMETGDYFKVDDVLSLLSEKKVDKE